MFLGLCCAMGVTALQAAPPSDEVCAWQTSASGGAFPQTHDESQDGEGLVVGADCERSLAVNAVASSKWLAFGLGVERQCIHAKEYVFETGGGRKVSELSWRSAHSLWVRAGVTFRPLERVQLRAQAAMTVGAKHSFMRDLDWTTNAPQPTRLSEHDDTQLRRGYEYQIEAAANVLQTRICGNPLDLNLLFSWSRTVYEWSAQGGIFQHEGGVSGTFPPNVRMIGYRQQWTTPEIGLQLGQQIHLREGGELHLSVRADWGFWGRFKPLDRHYQRRLAYVDAGHGAKSERWSVKLSWLPRANAEFFVTGAWRKFEQGRTDTTIFEFGDSQALVRIESGGGARIQSAVIGLGVRCRF